MSAHGAPNERIASLQQADSALARDAYDAELQKQWGGPAPRMFDAALRHPAFHQKPPTVAAGPQIALVTGSSGGCVLSLCCLSASSHMRRPG